MKTETYLLEAWLEEMEDSPITFDKHYQDKYDLADDDYIYGYFGIGEPPFYEGMVAEVFECNHNPKLWVEAINELPNIIKELIELRKYKQENEVAKELGFKI